MKLSGMFCKFETDKLGYADNKKYNANPLRCRKAKPNSAYYITAQELGAKTNYGICKSVSKDKISFKLTFFVYCKKHEEQNKIK